MGRGLRTLKLVIAYDGTDYCGWQIQPNGPTIQQELTDAVEAVTGEATAPVGSGRTDSGVHALGQVAHLKTASMLEPTVLQRALNAQLPDAISIRELTEASPGFDALRDARSKRYRYVFHDGSLPDVFSRRYCWTVHKRLDDKVMQSEARTVLGTHDFRCFETQWPNRASSVRTVTGCTVTRMGDFVCVDVEANGFLYNMVRSIAGTLYDVGRGRWPPGRMAQVLACGDRGLAGPTAPAKGLFLVFVEYA